MWVSAIRSVQRNVLKANQFIRLSSVSALAHLSPYYSDSSSEETISNTLNTTTVHESSLRELNSSGVVEILNNLRKDPVSAWQFFQQLKEKGFKHDVGTYVAIIRVLCYWRIHIKLDSVIVEVINSGREDLGFDISNLFEALLEGLEYDGSNSLVVALDVMIKSFATAGMFDEAIDTLFRTKRRGFGPSLLSCNYLINKLVECRKAEMALALYEQFGSLGLKPNAYTYAIVIKAYSRKGSLGKAGDVFMEMDEAGVVADSCVYTTFLEGVCDNGMPGVAYDILKKFRAVNAPIVADAYTAVLHGFVNQRKLNEAELVLRDMEEQGLVLDAYCYGFLIQGYCKAGNIIKAQAFHNEMTAKGDMKKARWVFDNMVWKGLVPDVVTYTMMIHGYCRVNSLVEAVGLFDDMNQRGVAPDIITFTIMLDGYSKINFRRAGNRGDYRIEEDRTALLAQMKEMNLEADSICYTVLIDSHCKSDNLQDAMNLFNEMIDIGVEPDTVTYTALLSGYCKRGDVERAVDLVNEMSLKGVQLDNRTLGILKAKKVQFRHTKSAGIRRINGPDVAVDMGNGIICG